MASTCTNAAFRRLRIDSTVQEPNRNLIANADECDQMTEADGLAQWQDGPLAGLGTSSGAPGGAPVPREYVDRLQLWVVRPSDVVAAPEHCPFGAARTRKRVKHTNLTGGGPAHCGGELAWVDQATLLLTGASGRYPPRSAQEMNAVALAFRDSGYAVWSMGFDADTHWPRRLSSNIDPEWVA